MEGYTREKEGRKEAMIGGIGAWQGREGMGKEGCMVRRGGIQGGSPGGSEKRGREHITQNHSTTSTCARFLASDSDPREQTRTISDHLHLTPVTKSSQRKKMAWHLQKPHPTSFFLS